MNKRTQKEIGKIVATQHPTSDCGQDLMPRAGYKTLGNHTGIVPKYALPASRLFKRDHVDFYLGFFFYGSSRMSYTNELVTATLNKSEKARHGNFVPCRPHQNATKVPPPALPLLSKATAPAAEAAGTNTCPGLSGCSSPSEHKNDCWRWQGSLDMHFYPLLLLWYY